MELVSNWLDGSLTETESAELQAVLESSADRRSEFVDVCGLDADLRLMSDVVIETPVGAESRRAPAGANGMRAVGWLGLVAAIAAVLLLAIGYGIGRDRKGDAEQQIAASEVASGESDEVVESGCAVLSRVVDAKFAGDVQYREGDSLQPGQFKLLSGAVQIDFFSGATMLIDEAADVNLVSSWEAECAHGKVTMHVPAPAIGFHLTLPGMKVVDLGTEFAVQVDGAESSLHVFDGEVEAHVPGSQMQIIREGSSLKKSTDLPVVAGVSKPADFPSVEEFERRKEEYYQTKTKQWRAAMNTVRSDERIIGCYQFRRWEDEKWDRLVNNFAIPKRLYSHGSAVGARWVDGRWPTKSALEFKSPGDRVRINLGKDKYDGLTMAAWIRVDGLDRKYNALLLSDGYEDGEPHWQIDKSGRLMFSVSYMRFAPSSGQQFDPYRQDQVFYSPKVVNSDGRRWHHVAVTFDAVVGEAVQYFDGKEVSREVSEHHLGDRKVTFGPCAIGNWGLPIEGVPFPVRNLNGRVDEFLIYKEPLTGDEIANLHELGIPN
ncbi:LamG-like jellyroll fold domain-containing protein [Rubripirellula tenax]|nr:LamG-like jellyroll fold domain-containing protein [Rubripirellula tenax]